MNEKISNWDVFEMGVVHTLGLIGKHKRPFLAALAVIAGSGTLLFANGQSDKLPIASTTAKPKSEIDLAIERAQSLLTTPGLFGNEHSFIEEMNAQGYSVLWEPLFGRAKRLRTGSAAEWGLIERPVPSTDPKYAENGRIWAGECVTWVTEVRVIDNRQKSVYGDAYVVTPYGHFFRLSTIENGVQPGPEGWYINADDPRCTKKLADESVDYGGGVIGPSLNDQILVNGPK